MERSASNTATGNFKFAVVTPLQYHRWCAPIPVTLIIEIAPGSLLRSVSLSLSVFVSLFPRPSTFPSDRRCSFRPRSTIPPRWMVMACERSGCRSSQSRFLVRRKSLGRTSPREVDRERERVRFPSLNIQSLNQGLSPVARDENKRETDKLISPFPFFFILLSLSLFFRREYVPSLIL